MAHREWSVRHVRAIISEAIFHGESEPAENCVGTRNASCKFFFTLASNLASGVESGSYLVLFLQNLSPAEP